MNTIQPQEKPRKLQIYLLIPATKETENSRDCSAMIKMARKRFVNNKIKVRVFNIYRYIEIARNINQHIKLN